MAILPVYLYGQPDLRKKAKPIREVDDGLRRTVEEMFETMHAAQGIGLAGNQIGLLKRVLVIDIRGIEGEEEVPPIVLVNPEVIEEKGNWRMEEGCLSIPEVREEVERAKSVRIAYKDIDFQSNEIEAEGLLGRVLLHEIDHLFDDQELLDAIEAALVRNRREVQERCRKGASTENSPDQ